MNLPAGKDSPLKAGHFRTTFLYVCLVAAGVFAAWQANRFCWPDDREDRSAPQRPRDVERSMRRWKRPASQPLGVVDHPTAVGGLEPIRTHPGGLAPPAEAKLRDAYRRPADDGNVEEFAKYEFSGEPGAVVEYYQDVLQAQGYAPFSDSTGADGRRTLVFSRNDTKVFLFMEGAQATPGAAAFLLKLICPIGESPSDE